MQVCSEFVDGLPSCLLGWYLKLCSWRDLHMEETRLIIQKFQHSGIWEFQLGMAPLNLQSVRCWKPWIHWGIFPPSLPECSFLWAALSGRNEIEDILLCSSVFLTVMISGFCWQVMLGPNFHSVFFQAVFWIYVTVVKKSYNCPWISKPTKREAYTIIEYFAGT